MPPAPVAPSLRLGAASGMILAAAIAAVGRSPALVRAWAEGLSPRLMLAAGWAASGAPLSIAEAGIALLIAVAAGAIGLVLARRWRPGMRPLLVGGAGLAAWAWVIFQAGWGLNYARAPLAERIGLDARAETTSAELSAVGAGLLAASVEAYREIHGAEDGGIPTQLPPEAAVDAAVEAAYAGLPARVGLEAAVGWARPPVKRILNSWWLTQVGILGFFSPFTGEANVHAYAPAQSLGHAIAHEKAHQRGIAPEDEANFVGYLACVGSGSPFLRYSGALFAYKQILSELGEIDPAAYEALRAGESPGIRRDFVDAWTFWHAHEGLLREAGRAVNDAYLKANGQAGTITYNHSLRLILAWARRPDPG